MVSRWASSPSDSGPSWPTGARSTGTEIDEFIDCHPVAQVDGDFAGARPSTGVIQADGGAEACGHVEYRPQVAVNGFLRRHLEQGLRHSGATSRRSHKKSGHD